MVRRRASSGLPRSHGPCLPPTQHTHYIHIERDTPGGLCCIEPTSDTPLTCTKVGGRPAGWFLTSPPPQGDPRARSGTTQPAKTVKNKTQRQKADEQQGKPPGAPLPESPVVPPEVSPAPLSLPPPGPPRARSAGQDHGGTASHAEGRKLQAGAGTGARCEAGSNLSWATFRP